MKTKTKTKNKTAVKTRAKAITAHNDDLGATPSRNDEATTGVTKTNKHSSYDEDEDRKLTTAAKTRTIASTTRMALTVRTRQGHGGGKPSPRKGYFL